MDYATARKILGVSQKASLEETRHRFRALAKLHHPDLNPGNDGTDFVLVSAAYLVLQERGVGASKTEDVGDYAFCTMYSRCCIDQYFGYIMSNFFQGIGAIENGLLAVLRSGGGTLHAAHGEDRWSSH
jgi:hypothetical protein